MNNEWFVYETKDSVHIVPGGDLLTHAVNPFCICGPRLDEDYIINDKRMFTHDSFDRREDEEWGDWDWDGDEEWEEDDEDW